MKLSELISIAGSEEKSEEFLRAKGILKTFKFCPFCGGKSIGRVRRKFFKNFSNVIIAGGSGQSGKIAYLRI
jgi:hypothetical protein